MVWDIFTFLEAVVLPLYGAAGAADVGTAAGSIPHKNLHVLAKTPACPNWAMVGAVVVVAGAASRILQFCRALLKSPAVMMPRVRGGSAPWHPKSWKREPLGVRTLSLAPSRPAHCATKSMLVKVARVSSLGSMEAAGKSRWQSRFLLDWRTGLAAAKQRDHCQKRGSSTRKSKR